MDTLIPEIILNVAGSQKKKIDTESLEQYHHRGAYALVPPQS
jgi:hypothetical protein